jgi:phytanoyl-CoA hydroxylase
MLKLRTPNGLDAEVPETLAEDTSPRFGLDRLAEAADYYREQGYVIVSGAVSPSDCDAIRVIWNEEVKPFAGKIYRQATAKLERHSKNSQGWVMNPILNLQSLDPRQLGRMRAYARDTMLTAPGLVQAFTVLLGERPKIVQSMYFEGNSATWEHQDSYYLDSEKIGAMAAAWIALEDISATAGRFFICPGSHKIDLGLQGTNIADSHADYIAAVVEHMREIKAEIRAPALRKGEILFWNALTVHGSLDSRDPNHSRSSITCHAIPATHRFMQFHARLFDLPVELVNGTEIFAPKDLSTLRNRLIYLAESNFPGPFYALKRAAIRHVVRKAA